MELESAVSGISEVGPGVNSGEKTFTEHCANALACIAAPALLCAIAMVCAPAGARAQAPPGPMHPVAAPQSDDPTGVGDVTRTHRPPPRPATKNDIAGTWKFNQDDSDDVLQKLKEARQGSGGRSDDGSGNNNPRSNNGGIHMGGMGSPYPGGTGTGGGGGGNNGGGNPRSRGANGSPSSELSANNPEIEEFTAPAPTLTFAMKENQIDLKDDSGRQRTYFTDDRRVAKLENQKPDEPQQFDAYWEDVKLVAREDLPHSVRVTREFEPQQGGMVLFENVTIETNHSNGYVELRLSYDRVGQPPPPAAITTSTAANGGANGGSAPITSTITAPSGGAPPIVSSTTAAPPATTPSSTQAAPSDAPTLKRPTSPQ